MKLCISLGVSGVVILVTAVVVSLYDRREPTVEDKSTSAPVAANTAAKKPSGSGTGRVAPRGTLPRRADRFDSLAKSPAFKRAIGAQLSPSERLAAWEIVRTNGLLDEAIAFLEERCDRAPSSPDLLVDLGEAYSQKILSLEDESEIDPWWAKAEGAFDRAVEIDAGHWRARFSRALAYSYLPRSYNLRMEAIKELEILKEFQRELPPESVHVETFIRLGDLYQREEIISGAYQSWSDGLAEYPDDGVLRQRVEKSPLNPDKARTK